MLPKHTFNLFNVYFPMPNSGSSMEVIFVNFENGMQMDLNHQLPVT